MTINVEYECENILGIPCEEIIKKVVLAALDDRECPYEAEVDILLTDNASIQAINEENRQIDAPTDVLSFPMVEYPAPGDFSQVEEDLSLFNPETGELMLGDMVISLEKVQEQAELYGHSTTRELAFLTAHSMYHLMGYDHMEEDERLVMEELQENLMNKMGILRD